MGFDLAKHGLNLKMGFKTNFGLILENQKTGMKRGEGEKEKKRKWKRRRREEEEFKKDSKVWNFGFLYGTMTFIMDLWNFKALFG